MNDETNRPPIVADFGGVGGTRADRTSKPHPQGADGDATKRFKRDSASAKPQAKTAVVEPDQKARAGRSPLPEVDRRKRFSFLTEQARLERLRRAVHWTPHTATEIIEAGVDAVLKKLEAENGKPFEPVPAKTVLKL